METKKDVVVIERAGDGRFACYLKESYPTFSLAGYGESVEEAKEDFWEAYNETKELEEAEGRSMPVLDVVYKYDMQSFFDYFNFLNISEVARRAGINPSLMRQYSKGITNAGERQYKKLNDAMTNITKELSMAVL